MVGSELVTICSFPALTNSASLNFKVRISQYWSMVGSGNFCRILMSLPARKDFQLASVAHMVTQRKAGGM